MRRLKWFLLILGFLLALNRLQTGGPTQTGGDQTPPPVHELAGDHAYVTAASLAVHAQPAGTDTVALLNHGELVTITQRMRGANGVWDAIKTSTGLTGYVSAFGLGSVEPTPISTHPPRALVGYFVQDQTTPSLPSFSAHYPSMTTLSPWMWRLNANNGCVDATADCLQPQFDEATLGQTLQNAGRQGLRTLALVQNFGDSNFDAQSLHNLLADPAAQQRAIAELDAALTNWGVSGVQIDLEQLQPADRDAFSHFVQALAARLHADGLLVTVAVPALTASAAAQPWGQAYDYGALGTAVDEMMLMTYDQHYIGGAPGPIAGIPWTTQVVSYALSQNVAPQKIVLGAAGYGYDWHQAPDGTWRTSPVSYAEAMGLAADHQRAILWDDSNEVPHFDYTDAAGSEHQVWFEDRYSISHKLDLVAQYGLGGVAIWRLGQEDPDVWALFDEMLHR